MFEDPSSESLVTTPVLFSYPNQTSVADLNTFSDYVRRKGRAEASEERTKREEKAREGRLPGDFQTVLRGSRDRHSNASMESVYHWLPFQWSSGTWDVEFSTE